MQSDNALLQGLECGMKWFYEHMYTWWNAFISISTPYRICGHAVQSAVLAWNGLILGPSSVTSLIPHLKFAKLATCSRCAGGKKRVRLRFEGCVQPLRLACMKF